MEMAKGSILVKITQDNIEDYLKSLDKDVSNLFLMSQGRIEFGEATSGKEGLNISGEYIYFTSSGTANLEFNVSHTLGVVPRGYLVIYKDKAGDLYQGPTTGTAWTTDTIYLKCSVATVTFMVFLLK